MKIDRVILSSNANPVYYHFWNPLSKVYKEKFGIKPTLVWIGTEQELKECGISDEHGDIMIIEAHPDYGTPFQSTWALYWATQFFPDDVCFVCGIDEVPLGPLFIRDIIAPYSNEDYVMTIADAYLPNHWTLDQSASPSGQHCAKGYTFMEIYAFERDFKQEVEKVVNAGVRAFWEDTAGRWGLDETYFSLKLRQYPNKDRIKSLNNFALMCERRIECERHKETPYDLNRLQSGWYSQAHLCRPFTNHVEYITKLYNDIPVL